MILCDPGMSNQEAYQGDLSQWLASYPAQTLAAWHNRKGWLAPIPWHRATERSGVILSLV